MYKYILNACFLVPAIKREKKKKKENDKKNNNK